MKPQYEYLTQFANKLDDYNEQYLYKNIKEDNKCHSRLSIYEDEQVLITQVRKELEQFPLFQELDYNRKHQHKRLFGYEKKLQSPRSSILLQETILEIVFSPFYWATFAFKDSDLIKMTASSGELSFLERNQLQLILKTKLPQRKYTDGKYSNQIFKRELLYIIDQYKALGDFQVYLLNHDISAHITLIAQKINYNDLANQPEKSINSIIHNFNDLLNKYHIFLNSI